MKTNVLLIGNADRGQAIAEALARSKPRPTIFAWMKANNPGIAELSDQVLISKDCLDAVAFAKKRDVGLAFIGPEEPLGLGMADVLEANGILTVAPTQELAKIETSKAWTRDLVEGFCQMCNPRFRVFDAMDDVEAYLKECFRKGMHVVLKPDGLTGGKGVMVQGEHFTTLAEALAICRDILSKHPAVVIEEKLEGEEFSLQCFCDGENVVAMPPVQDFKRRLVGDLGLNTGSMGAYSSADHLLPFLTKGELERATDIVQRIVVMLHRKTGKFYRGIIYGSFMITAGDHIKLIEVNARFGKPEAINVLALLETDLVAIGRSIARCEEFSGLDQLGISFRHQATVVKYVVPYNYGLPKDQWVAPRSDLIEIRGIAPATLYYSSVNSDSEGRCHLTSSRAAAVLGMAPDLAEAERIAEQGARAITGAVAHRSDIGTAALINKSVRRMEELRKLQPSH